jgi:hypothetical protein
MDSHNSRNAKTRDFDLNALVGRTKGRAQIPLCT